MVGGRRGGQSFKRATGIKMAEWYPHIWLRWGEALAEAGHSSDSGETNAIGGGRRILSEDIGI
jgi:hypothetical protein